MNCGNPATVEPRAAETTAGARGRTICPEKRQRRTPVADHFAGGTVQLGSQLGARRTGAYDGHVKLARTYRTVLRLRANAGIQQAAIEAPRLIRCFQRYRVLGDAWCAEIIGDAADCDH